MKFKKPRSFAPFLVFSILLLVYLLTFSGFASTDDEQLFSTLTANLAHGRSYSALPLFGNNRIQGESGGVEPLHPILGIPFYLFAEQFDLGQVQVLYILPGMYTALTAALLAAISEMRGYTQRTALLFGLIYGLGTIAFQFARTNFREPLAALLIATAVLCIEKTMEPHQNKWGNIVYPAIGSLVLIFAVLTKITTAILIPFLVFVFIIRKRLFRKNNRSMLIISTLLTAFLITCIVVVFRSHLPINSLNRFTFHFLDYIRYTLPRLPHDHFLSALAGLYFSPGKGLFLYSPILVLALISPFLKRKMERWDWFIYMGALLALSSVQALIYDDQWWSISWGTRALLPALPLAYLAVLPALGVVIDSKRNIIHFFTALLMILSVLIQISRLLTSDAVYVNWVVQFTGKSINADMLWDLRLAPLFQHWRLAFTNQNSDIAWLFINKQSMMLFPLLILFMLISLVYISILVIKRKNNPIKTSIIKFLLTTALILSPIATQFDQRYNKDVVVFNEVSDQICQETQKDDLVLIDAYLTPFWWFYSNFGCYKSDWVGLPYIHQTAIHSELYYPRFPDLERIVQNTLINGKQVFLIQFPQENVLLYSEEFNKAGYPIDLTTTYENPNTQVFVFRH